MNLGTYGVETHENVLKFWKDNNIYEKSRQIFINSNNKKPFYFLQGPPYTSGKFHIAHAWNNSIKDFIIRFKRMSGFEVWDRGGYDMHGLPTARKVQALHKLKTKEDIEKFGFENFANECIKISKGYAEEMSNELFDIGIWMDHKHAYMPIEQDYIDGIWFLIKKAHEKNRLYQGLRTTSWCRECATALAKHEQEYTELTDTSIFVKYQSVDNENLYYIIWTTTPWTITFNLGIMIHPDFEYSKVEVNVNDKKEYWIIAKELVDSVMKTTEYNYKIIDNFLGKTLEGKRYNHFWTEEIEDLKKINQSNKKAHSILLSNEFVTLSTGSGLVHTAPGCGPEDYEIGYRNGLPAFNTINEYGAFPEKYGRFTGLIAKVDDKKFIEAMKKDNVLIAKSDFVHDYATCERCHTPVVFRTTKQWFFKVEDLKEKMIELNRTVNWIPKTGGTAFESWLENLRDNSITKQRFWGTPVPIWKCDKCGEIHVIGSKDELKTKVNELPENLHKPWIDSVKWKCEKCDGTMIRLPDILDVWIDAGTASWNSLYYPKTDEYFKKFFPADFILEAREQVRGWFNLLMVTSIIGFDDRSFKSCYMHGMLTDVDGVKMSKSIGNIIRPHELTDKYGADTLRFYMSRTKAGNDINFSWDEAKLAYKNLMILWNVHKLFIESCKDINKKPELVTDVSNFDKTDKYVLSRFHRSLKTVTEYFNNYFIDSIASEIESLFLEISRTYIQLNREDMNFGSDERKIQVMNTLYTVLLGVVKMLAPVTPFISEQIYQNLKELEFVNKESVHLEFWDSYNDNLIDDQLEKEFNISLNIIESGLSARDKSQIGVRWPLQELLIDAKAEFKDNITHFEDIIKSQLNIKNIKFGHPKFNISVEPNYREIGAEFGTETGDVLTAIKPKLDHIAEVFKEGNDYNININDKEFILSQKLFKITKSCEGYSISESKIGEVYLNTKITPELEIEGFVREITRRIQNLRKTSDLNKSDLISLSLELPSDLAAVKNYEDLLKTKVGAESISYDSVESNEFKSEEKVKGKSFKIGLTKK